jgi:hypothetical protein
MTNDIVIIESLYADGMDAYRNGKYSEALSLFRSCIDHYEGADFPIYNEDVSDTAQMARNRFNEIAGYSYEDDELSYGK